MVLKKAIVKFLSVLCLSTIWFNSNAQKQHLELKNIQTNTIRKIKEDEQITVHTTQFKIKGALKIIDKKTIMIKGKKIMIDDIIKIQNETSQTKLRE